MVSETRAPINLRQTYARCAERRVIRMETPRAMELDVTEDTLTAELADGRTISVPLVWYPRLVHATSEERDNWEILADGEQLRWPDLDEDLSVEGLLAGWPSGESRRSLQLWLEAKKEGRSVELHDILRYERERRNGDAAAN